MTYNFKVTIADDPALLCAKISTGMLTIKFISCECNGLTHEHEM